MKMKSKYLDVITHINELELDPLKVSDAIIVHDMIKDEIKVPTDCIDDVIESILDVYYKNQDGIMPFTLEEIVEGYKYSYEQFGCNPVSNYNFVVDSDKFLAQSLHKDDIDLGDLGTIDISEIDLDDEREWED